MSAHEFPCPFCGRHNDSPNGETAFCPACNEWYAPDPFDLLTEADVQRHTATLTDDPTNQYDLDRERILRGRTVDEIAAEAVRLHVKVDLLATSLERTTCGMSRQVRANIAAEIEEYERELAELEMVLAEEKALDELAARAEAKAKAQQAVTAEG